jgi:hypothetical protein
MNPHFTICGHIIFRDVDEPMAAVRSKAFDGNAQRLKWCRRGESNPRPRDYETLALPLSYAGAATIVDAKVRFEKCQGAMRSEAIRLEAAKSYKHAPVA